MEENDSAICKIKNIYVYISRIKVPSIKLSWLVAAQIKEENIWLDKETHFFMCCLPVWKEKSCCCVESSPGPNRGFPWGCLQCWAVREGICFIINWKMTLPFFPSFFHLGILCFSKFREDHSFHKLPCQGQGMQKLIHSINLFEHQVCIRQKKSCAWLNAPLVSFWNS